MDETPNFLKSAVEETEPELSEEEMGIRLDVVYNDDPEGYEDNEEEYEDEDEDDMECISSDSWSEFQDCQVYAEGISADLRAYWHTFSEEEHLEILNNLRPILSFVEATKDLSNNYYD